MGSSQSASTCKENKKCIVVENTPKIINYDETVRQFLWFHFFRKRRGPSEKERTELERIVNEENETEVDLKRQAKALKFARILYFNEDVSKAEKKNEADRKALELEIKPIPIQFRMYEWGNPAPVDFTEAECIESLDEIEWRIHVQEYSTWNMFTNFYQEFIEFSNKPGIMSILS
ncbi:unnamed protein product [Rodentolepis nana]|uniref:Uncharacterized protein n=1 Tax=Rodentolepis nana TaxID=102285 RepID=A0A0R3TUQ5_RODNA|nr:unnamed protein product [Rodentolepis nana]